MMKAIAYYRVSTKRQGRSGLGLEAQEKAIEDFVKSNDYMVVGEFIEIESGRVNKRPVLEVALAECKRLHATLLIAKLDRLSRNVAFISALLESKIDFKAVDNPFAEKFTLHILAAVAEKEREDASKRTKEALQAAKRRGVELGKHGRYVLSRVNKMHSRQFAVRMIPVINRIKGEGLCSIRAITEELNRLQIPTYRNNGTKWHVNTVHKIITMFTIKTQRPSSATY